MLAYEWRGFSDSSRLTFKVAGSDRNELYYYSSHNQTIKELRRVFAAYGLPEHLVSDNGPQFTSAEFAQFMKANCIKHIRCAPYHPSSNGCAERFVQTFKRAISSGVYIISNYYRKCCQMRLEYDRGLSYIIIHV